MDKNKILKISKFHQDRKRMPSYQEIMALFGFKSKNAAYYLVNKLIGQGLLEKDKTGRLIPLAALFAVPILGTVEAGFPSPAEEETADLMSMDEYLIENREATFILKVSGESMIDAGIMPGDMVLVERGRTPHDGDIVIAEVDNAWTMKYFRKTGNKITLEPANKKFQPIIPKSDLRIAAVVRSVIRKY